MANPFLFVDLASLSTGCFLVNLMPCIGPGDGNFCGVKDPCTAFILFPGDPAITYNVVITVRGVFEQKDYTGGSHTGPFQIGGVPANDAQNMPRLHVNNPPQDYYLNRRQFFANVIVPLCYTRTIPIKGGAVISLHSTSFDAGQLANCVPPHVGCTAQTVPLGCSALPNLVTPAQPYNGQFIRVDFDCSIFLPMP